LKNSLLVTGTWLVAEQMYEKKSQMPHDSCLLRVAGTVTISQNASDYKGIV
jgi:hypothetical protein